MGGRLVCVVRVRVRLMVRVRVSVRLRLRVRARVLDIPHIKFNMNIWAVSL